MAKYNVYVVSDWPETEGEDIGIWKAKEFETWEAALAAGQEIYPGSQILVEKAE